MLSRMRWSEQVLLFNKIFHSFKHYFFKDLVEIRKQSDRPIIFNVSIIILFENRYDLCHF